MGIRLALSFVVAIAKQIIHTHHFNISINTVIQFSLFNITKVIEIVRLIGLAVVAKMIMLFFHLKTIVKMLINLNKFYVR